MRKLAFESRKIFRHSVQGFDRTRDAMDLAHNSSLFGMWQIEERRPAPVGLKPQNCFTLMLDDSQTESCSRSDAESEGETIAEDVVMPRGERAL